MRLRSSLTISFLLLRGGEKAVGFLNVGIHAGTLMSVCLVENAQ